MAKTVDDLELYEIHERRQGLAEDVAEGKVKGDAVLKLLDDADTLIRALTEERQKLAFLRKRNGAALYNRQLSTEALLKRQYRLRSGLTPDKLYLLVYFIQNFPSLSVSDCGKKATGEEMTAGQVKNILYRSGYKITIVPVRVVAPHGRHPLPPIPIPLSYEEAMKEAGLYNLPLPEGVQEPDEEGNYAAEEE